MESVAIFNWQMKTVASIKFHLMEDCGSVSICNFDNQFEESEKRFGSIANKSY